MQWKSLKAPNLFVQQICNPITECYIQTPEMASQGISNPITCLIQRSQGNMDSTRSSYGFTPHNPKQSTNFAKNRKATNNSPTNWIFQNPNSKSTNPTTTETDRNREEHNYLGRIGPNYRIGVNSVRTVLTAVILVGAENVVGRGEIERLGARVVVAAGRSGCHEERS